MGRLIDDSVKQKLLDELSSESTMIISTAYAYAKNYVNYGEDITKAWTTATQQASIIAQVRQKAWKEAYDSFKKDYEARLKADMVAMLTDIQLEIEELYPKARKTYRDGLTSYCEGVDDSRELIQQKIDALKAESEDNKC